MLRLALIGAAFLLLAISVAVVALPYIAPTFAFRHSPVFSQVFLAYCRDGWDFEGGWKRIDGRFPDANQRLMVFWQLEGVTVGRRRRILDFASHMCIEGFQREQGMAIILSGLRSGDRSIRVSAIGYLHYGAPPTMSHEQIVGMLKAENIELRDDELSEALTAFGLKL